MIIKDGWDNFFREIKENNKPIVCFGAGAVASYMETVFLDYGIWDKIKFFIDNDSAKEGGYIGETKKIPVLSTNSFLKRKESNFVFLIAIEAYVTIENQFNRLQEWENIICYAYIKLNCELQKKIEQPLELIGSGKERIPRKIHYFWFGGFSKNALRKKCIESWRRICPDYEIIEWNEENYDISKSKYMRQAYEAGKWAYAADYARLDILYDHGGIYMDTDVELLSPLDRLLGVDGFIAHGQWPIVNSGGGIGCVKGNRIIKEMLANRCEMSFYLEDGSLNMTENAYYESKILRKHGYKIPFLMQYADDMLVLAPEIMATASTLGERIFVTENTIALHHCEGSWVNRKILTERKVTMINGGYDNL